LCNLREKHGQFIIKYYIEFPLKSKDFQPEPVNINKNVTSPNQIFISQKLKKKELKKITAPAEIWHQRLGHYGPEPLEYIESESIKMTHEPGPKIIDCKIYSKIKDKRIVSRQPV
jgi:hypothetical protein